LDLVSDFIYFSFSGLNHNPTHIFTYLNTCDPSKQKTFLNVLLNVSETFKRFENVLKYL